MGDGVGRAGLHAVSAKNTAVVIDVVDASVTLAAGDADLIGVFRRFNIDAVGRAGRGTEEAGHAFFKTVLVALEDVHTAVALLELRRLVGIVFGDRGRHHFPEGHAHALGNGGRRPDQFLERIWHLYLYFILAPDRKPNS